jgi:hypothetical protein
MSGKKSDCTSYTGSQSGKESQRESQQQITGGEIQRFHLLYLFSIALLFVETHQLIFN